MRPIEKINLLESIGTELQSRMTYSDIDIYLTAFGIDTTQIVDSYNSKRLYAKDQLARVSDQIILDIARDLDLKNLPTTTTKKSPSHWKSGYFRLFLSHLASFKVQTSALQSVLNHYAISSFVAHEDIEPTKEWQDEIEAALHSMDALAAILTKGFKESNWCDQEVGVAVGRDTLIIPVRRGIDPYGFIGKYQGIQANGKNVGEVAKAIFDTLMSSPKTRSKMIRSLCNAISQSTNLPDAEKRLDILANVKELPKDSLEQLRDSVIENDILVNNTKFTNTMNGILSKYNLAIISEAKPTFDDFDDDIPF